MRLRYSSGGAPRNCSRFVYWYGFHLNVFDSVYVPILMYCCTRIQYVALAIVLSNSGERMHRDRIPPQRMHAACIVSLHGGHVVPSALRSSTATVRAFVVWNSWSRRYAPQMRENLLPVRKIRRQKAATYDTCTDHPIGRTVITLHKPPVPHDPWAGSVQEVVHGRRVMYCPRI